MVPVGRMAALGGCEGPRGVNRENGGLTIEKIAGTTKDDIQVIKNRTEDYKAQVNKATTAGYTKNNRINDWP